MPDWLMYDPNYILRLAGVGSLAYIFLIIMLRLSGKRSLSKMNAFDFIVTVALGSILATVIMDPSISLSEGFAALALLLILQFAVTKGTVYFPVMTKLVKSKPALLYYDGQYLTRNMRSERIVHDEVREAVRASGFGDLGQVKAVVLETDGTLSVIGKDDSRDDESIIPEE